MSKKKLYDDNELVVSFRIIKESSNNDEKNKAYEHIYKSFYNIIFQTVKDIIENFYHEDAVQEIFAHIFKSIPNYDETISKPSTFIMTCMRTILPSLKRELSRSPKATDKINRFKCTAVKLKKEGIDNPTEEQILKKAGIEKPTYQKALQMEQCLSLEQTFNTIPNEEGKPTLQETLSDDFNLEQYIIEKEEIEEKRKTIIKLNKAINTLDPKEKEIIRLRYFEKKSAKEVGKSFGYSNHSGLVRRVNGKILPKLKKELEKQ